MTAEHVAPVVDHVALAVGRGEGPLAARLLGLLGLDVVDNGPSLVGDPWYTVAMAGMADGAPGFFVVPVSDEQLALEQAVGSQVDASTLAAFVEERRRKPDSTTHVALTAPTLEHLERVVVALRTDAHLAGRVAVAAYRPAEPTPGVDERLARSPAFADAHRVGYLRDGVQVFLHTDVVATGLLVLGQSIELNHRLAVP